MNADQLSVIASQTPEETSVHPGCKKGAGDVSRLTDHLVLVVALEDLPRLVLLLLVEHAVLARVEPEEVTARLVQVFDVFRRLEERRVSNDADRGGTVNDEVDRVAAACEECTKCGRCQRRGWSLLSRRVLSRGGEGPLPLESLLRTGLKAADRLTKAVTDRRKLLHTLSLEVLNHLVDLGARDLLAVLAEPAHQVKLARAVVAEADGVTLDDVGHVDGDTVRRERVDEELPVREFGTKDAVSDERARSAYSSLPDPVDIAQAYSVRKMRALVLS